MRIHNVRRLAARRDLECITADGGLSPKDSDGVGWQAGEFAGGVDQRGGWEAALARWEVAAVGVKVVLGGGHLDACVVCYCVDGGGEEGREEDVGERRDE